MERQLVCIFVSAFLAVLAQYAKGSTGVFPIYTGGGQVSAPAIDGNIVVWKDYRGIYGYNLALKSEFVIYASTGSVSSPDIDGDIVVWEARQDPSSDIYGKNLSTGQVFLIGRQCHHY